MTDSSNSNIYTYQADAAWARHAEHLAGARQGLVAVVGTRMPSEAVQNALEASFQRLGYGADPCTWMALEGVSGAAVGVRGDEIAGETVAAGTPAAALTTAELYGLLEALDPLVLVATDAAAGRALGAVYRAEFKAMAHCRALGRSVVVLPRPDELLASREGKQRLWTLLKQLGR